MKFKHKETQTVDSRRGEVFEVFLSTGEHEVQYEDRTDYRFGISLEGDTYDGDDMDYASFEALLPVEKAKELYDELGRWLNAQGVVTSRGWNVDIDFNSAEFAQNFEKIDRHDGSPGRGVNKQDAGS